MKLVAVLWDDAYIEAGPKPVSDLDDHCMAVCCGILVRETKESVWIAQGYYQEKPAEYENVQRIPKSLIRWSRGAVLSEPPPVTPRDSPPSD